jgi:hypothetical protein
MFAVFHHQAALASCIRFILPSVLRKLGMARVSACCSIAAGFGKREREREREEKEWKPIIRSDANRTTCLNAAS